MDGWTPPTRHPDEIGTQFHCATCVDHSGRVTGRDGHRAYATPAVGRDDETRGTDNGTEA